MFLLWQSGDFVVHYALRIASLYGITTLFSGFAIMAVASGLPELAVAFSAILSGVSQLSVANIIGSNLVALTLVLGLIAAIGGPIFVGAFDYSNIIMMYVIALLAMVSVFFIGTIGKIYGVLLVVGYLVTLWLIWFLKLAPRGDAQEIGGSKKRKTTLSVDMVRQTLPESVWSSKLGVLVLFSVAMSALLVSAQLVVWIAASMCTYLTWRLESLGATVLAVGTSLADLSVAASAIRRKEYMLVLGNAFGSVLVQGVLILGLQGVFSQKPLDIVPLRSVAPFMLVAFAVIGYGLIKRKKINRIDGIMLLVVFCLFIGYEFIWMR